MSYASIGSSQRTCAADDAVFCSQIQRLVWKNKKHKTKNSAANVSILLAHSVRQAASTIDFLPQENDLQIVEGNVAGEYGGFTRRVSHCWTQHWHVDFWGVCCFHGILYLLYFLLLFWVWWWWWRGFGLNDSGNMGYLIDDCMGLWYSKDLI